MSLDETCLSNGEVYTILTNKATHGGKGALAAMVRGVASDTVSEILKKVPRELRRRVKTVTTDLSSAMMLTVRTVFPKAMLINDRFHVQQLVTDAIDQMRIGFRWEVFAEENKAIREHHAKCKAAHTRAEKDLIGEWEPQRMENGETKPQIMARSRHIILMHKTKWNAQQQARAAILFRMFPKLEEAYNIYLELVDIFNKKSKPAEARLNLARWYNKVRRLATMASAKSLRRLRTTMQPSSTTSKTGSPMHRQNPSMLKSRLSERSSEGLETSGSLCTDLPHFILD